MVRAVRDRDRVNGLHELLTMHHLTFAEQAKQGLIGISENGHRQQLVHIDGDVAPFGFIRARCEHLRHRTDSTITFGLCF